ncbi:hypothetical protein BFJ68_g15620 [Fusarium oxysporum]|uniref:Serine aminopeptidase S33 domain-containing protein n=1 Tax=Fusarium oxysporum TaxID=5507 RepID=A0A420PL64_FUSOX|nr:hypothetical protein BFJ68_g15620 [Fusarium oxysporum]
MLPKHTNIRISSAIAAAASATQQPNRCDVTCQLNYGRALAVESSRWVNQNISTDDFYSNPANLSDYSAGDLVNHWFRPDSFSNPVGKDKPFRTVALTYGTAGLTRQCVPSNHCGVYYEWQGPFALVQQGYVVVAPDYAGQGSDILQGFMYESGALHAADVSFGLQAVRQALGNRITKEWVVVGHSEGGITAWRTDEREAQPGKATGGSLGAISIAPTLQPIKLIPESFRREKDGPAGDVVSIFLLQSISRLFPSIKVEDYVTDTVLSRIALADQGCLGTGGSLYGNLTVNELYKNTSWIEHPDFIDWQKRYNGAGPHPLAAPMLVIQGEADILTYAEYAEEDFDATCKKYPGSTAEYKLYPKLDHGVALQASQADFMTWIKDRFEKVPLKKVARRLLSDFWHVILDPLSQGRH